MAPLQSIENSLRPRPSLKRRRSFANPPLATCASTFSVKVCTSGYRMLYSPSWTFEHTVTLFLETYELGVEWAPRVEVLLRDQVVPIVRRAIEAAAANPRRKESKENIGNTLRS
ncbi:hypothetical protein RQP46_006564 [Phenoliferia psychrophenolica]